MAGVNTAVYSNATPVALIKIAGAGVSGDTLFISDAVNTTENIMIMPLELLVNFAAGQIKTIDNSIKVISTGLNRITLAAGSTLSPIPSVNDRYEIIPRTSEVIGNGINAEAYAVMDSS